MPEATILEEPSIDSLKERVVILTKQLTEIKGLKKAAMKKYNDDIKDYEEELQATLELLKENENVE